MWMMPSPKQPLKTRSVCLAVSWEESRRTRQVERSFCEPGRRPGAAAAEVALRAPAPAAAEQSKLTALLYNAVTTAETAQPPDERKRGAGGRHFDRAWGATINDYAWNEAYSRSIAVDIRYVLW